ncbi:hypothetical protein Tco_0363807 [Tanacetum coccineum]
MVYEAMNVESTPHIRAPVDDTQELFGDDQSTDSKESKDEESGEQTTSSQEEEMGPSLLTMQLKFDFVPNDVLNGQEAYLLDKEYGEEDVELIDDDCHTPKIGRQRNSNIGVRLQGTRDKSQKTTSKETFK